MYKALYRKWRPLSFSDVVGQAHVTETLKKQILSGRLSHAYLFTGTRGTGKTSCAKILARAVNCENPQNGDPCNQCPSCRGILDGSILDVIEMDAASNNGVDSIRDLRDELIYSPAVTKKRVYIIDEVHMLSTAAFNALLKTLEEPPSHVLFILATTEVHKVPATILSRCQKFAFKRILPAQLAERLTQVSASEGIALMPDAAMLIARMADGSMRDALSILDQCAASGETIDMPFALSLLGLAGAEQTAALVSAVGRKDTKAALALFSQLYAAGKDVAATLDELIGLMRDLLLIKTLPAGSVTPLSGLDEPSLTQISAMFEPAILLHDMTQLQQTLSELPRSQNRRIDAELCLVRLCDDAVSGAPSALSARLAALERTVSSLGSGARAGQGVSGAEVSEPPAQPPTSAAPPAARTTHKPAQEQTPDTSEHNPADPGGTPQMSPAVFWPELLSLLRQTVSVPEYTHLVLAEAHMDKDTLVVYLPEEFSYLFLHGRGIEEKVQEEACRLLKKQVAVRLTREKGVPEKSDARLDDWLSQNSALSDIITEE